MYDMVVSITDSIMLLLHLRSGEDRERIEGIITNAVDGASALAQIAEHYMLEEE